MSVTLAATWPPRGELVRIRRMVDELTSLYEAVVVVMPPDAPEEIAQTARSLPGVDAYMVEDWRSAKHFSLQRALETGVEWVHYCDFDRVLHWLECYADELEVTVKETRADCLILGRTAKAWATHPRCMVETEALFNVTFSYLLRRDMDLGAGSRVFSRTAAAHIIEKCPADWGWAVDVAWPLVLQSAGFDIDYRAVNGLAWETPDQFRERSANQNEQEEMAEAYDLDPVRWRERVAVADEITRVGVLALERLNKEKMRHE